MTAHCDVYGLRFVLMMKEFSLVSEIPTPIGASCGIRIVSMACL